MLAKWLFYINIKWEKKLYVDNVKNNIESSNHNLNVMLLTSKIIILK